MAYKAFHRSVTAGIALASAGAVVFATSPIAPADEVVAAPPALSSPRVVTTDVQPAALTSALQILTAGAFQAVQESLGAFGDEFPAMWAKVVEQWPDPTYLTLNYSLVASSFLTPVAPLVVGPFTDAVAEVVAQAFPDRADEIRENLPAAVDYAFARIVGPFVSAFSAIGIAHYEAYEAGMAGDQQARLLAILKAPLDMIDGFLFGGYGDLGPLITGDLEGELIVPPGLLTPWGQWPVDRNITPEAPGDLLTLSTQEVSTEEELTTGDATVAKGVPVTDELPAVVETAVEEIVETVVPETVGTVVPEPTEIVVPETEETVESEEEPVASEDTTSEKAEDTSATEEKADPRAVRKDLDSKRDDVKKPTRGTSAGADKTAAKPEDAPKADKSEKAAAGDDTE